MAAARGAPFPRRRERSHDPPDEVRLLAEPEAHDHLVKFYEAEDDLTDAVGRYLAEGARRDEAIIVIAKASRRVAIQRALAADGLAVPRLVDSGRLVVLDAEETLALITNDSVPDAAAFEKVVGGAVARVLSRGPRRVRAYGEMVDVLWGDGKLDEALQLERLWNDLLRCQPITLLCAYRMSFLQPGRSPEAFLHVCEVHSHALLPEDRVRLDAAVNQAFDEVVGRPYAADLKPLIHANLRVNDTLGAAERMVFWVTRNLPDDTDRLLARARHHLHAV